jgi:hypothetical protein
MLEIELWKIENFRSSSTSYHAYIHADGFSVITAYGGSSETTLGEDVFKKVKGINRNGDTPQWIDPRQPRQISHLHNAVSIIPLTIDEIGRVVGGYKLAMHEDFQMHSRELAEPRHGLAGNPKG